MGSFGLHHLHNTRDSCHDRGGGKPGGAAPGNDGRNMDHLCLRIEPFDQAAVIAHLAAHGVKLGEIGRRYGAEGMAMSIYLTDPEGNVVELRGPPDEEPGPKLGS